MAKYSMSADLGALIGVRFMNIPNAEGKAVPSLVIPAAINGLEVQKNDRNSSGIRAYLRLRQVNSSQKYLSAIRQSKTAKGEPCTEYDIPYLQVALSLPEKLREKIRAAIKTRVLAEHPEWAQQEDKPGTDLSRAISTIIPYTLGDCYLINETRDQSAAPQPNAPVAQQVAGYTPVQFDEDGGIIGDDSDLPF